VRWGKCMCHLSACRCECTRRGADCHGRLLLPLALARKANRALSPSTPPPCWLLPHLCVTPAIRVFSLGGDLRKRASTASERLTAIVAFLLFLEFAPDRHGDSARSAFVLRVQNTARWMTRPRLDLIAVNKKFHHMD
jgi:hypothetical protein